MISVNILLRNLSIWVGGSLALHWCLFEIEELIILSVAPHKPGSAMLSAGLEPNYLNLAIYITSFTLASVLVSLLLKLIKARLFDVYIITLVAALRVIAIALLTPHQLDLNIFLVTLSSLVIFPVSYFLLTQRWHADQTPQT